MEQEWSGEAIAGAVAFALGVGWSIKQKWQARRAVRTALEMPAGSTDAELKAVLKETRA